MTHQYMELKIKELEKRIEVLEGEPSIRDELPSVTPKQRTGHWIFDEVLDRHYYCSECKGMGVDYWDYCPNCGAKMEEQA